MQKAQTARATVSGARLCLGVLNLQVDLVSAQPSKKNAASDAPKLRNICPTCENPSLLKQELYCESSHHGPFGSADADKAMADGDGLVRVDPNEVKVAKAPETKDRSIELHVYRSREVEAATLPSGTLYRLRPTRGPKAAPPSESDLRSYHLLTKLVAATELAFVAEVVVKGVSQMYRCIVHDGSLTLVGLVRPAEVVPSELLEIPELPDCEDRLVREGRKLVKAATETFEPEAWQDGAQLRLRELRDETAVTSPAPVTPDAKAAAEELVELLRRSAA